ncbi:division plane positioning ATPase MipZ [Sodalis endosymbiont of Spalangia cameroni]|uniref:division plane positioning ATPase MipZ n=1 Tax=Sodalis praecaptivus TaxID=1239307 RepID=UPI0031F824AC
MRGVIGVFASDKGGVGKSTCLVSCAIALTLLTGKKVCVIEADPQRSTKKWLERRIESGITPSCGFKEAYGTSLERVATKMVKDYSYVLIDTAGRDSVEQRISLTFADVFLSYIQPSQVDLETLEEHTVKVREGWKLNPTMKVMHVLNRCSTHLGDSDAQDTYNMLNSDPEWWLPVARQRIYDRKAHRRAFADAIGVHETTDNKAKGEIELLLKEVGFYG